MKFCSTSGPPEEAFNNILAKLVGQETYEYFEEHVKATVFVRNRIFIIYKSDEATKNNMLGHIG